MSSVNEFEKCILCDTANPNPLPGYEKDFLVQCGHCGFVFCNRIPTAEELVKHYEQYSRANIISPITLKRYEQLLEKFEPYRKTNNIIDVGCGDGFFLQVAKQKGWNVYGTEFTEKAVEVCSAKGISMKQGPLDNANYNGIQFDVVTSFEVIEHINNPNEEITKFYSLLRKGGIVYATTPNFNSISRTLLKGTWSVIEYPEHLSYYTASTIKKLFAKHGFRTLSITVSGLSIDRIRQGLGKKETRPAFTGSDEKIRQQADSSFLYQLAFKMVNGLLNFTRKGDSLKGTFQKR